MEILMVMMSSETQLGNSLEMKLQLASLLPTIF